MRQLEAEILNELREVAKNPKIKQRDIMEWSTGEIKAEDGEQLYRLPKLQVNVCVKLAAKK